MGFELEFWGVRGSIACPSPKHVIYGGNTSCLEVRAGDQRIVLDAGTGLRELGNKYVREQVRTARLLLTHTHWDHINGFPFFAPGFQAGRTFVIMAGHLGGENGATRQVLAGQMARPTFPEPSRTRRPTSSWSPRFPFPSRERTASCAPSSTASWPAPTPWW